VLRSGTLSSAARKRHSPNLERRRSATPFLRAGAGVERPLFPLFYFWKKFPQKIKPVLNSQREIQKNFARKKLKIDFI
jgi:hypothetical protein